MAVSMFEVLSEAIRNESPAALATVVDGPCIGERMLVAPGSTSRSTISDPDLRRVVRRDVEAAMYSGISATRRYGAQGQANPETSDDAVTVMVFIEAFAPPPRMVVFGAVDFTAALVRVAKVLGYHVTVCDAREVFATKARFPLADEVVVDWPNRYLDEHGAQLGPRDAVCVLTHDAKFDVPAIVSALRCDVGYIGAMGSRRTTEQRTARLRAEGVTDDELARVRAPIGLDLGARTPEETAVSVCAEIIATHTGRPVPALRNAEGPIH
jgi:xanthine dehydrogenase accessory factor